jgi:methylated-DNA-[protein]-cysteine S-methyltransferase
MARQEIKGADRPESSPASGFGKNRVEGRPRAPDVPLMDRPTHHYRVFETAGGFCGIAWNRVGITRFQLPTRSAAATERLLQRRVPGAAPGDPPRAVAEAIAAATRYFAGETVDFSGIALDLGGQAPLFERIYGALRRVGWGHTTTYGALAKELGQGPEVARDVGEAMARNPVPLIIPCHRVLAAGGKLGGFSAPGGAATKRRMLELEGVSVDPPPPAQQAFGF